MSRLPIDLRANQNLGDAFFYGPFFGCVNKLFANPLVSDVP